MLIELSALVLSHVVCIDFICTALFIDNKIVDEYTLECLGERLATDTDILLILLAKQKNLHPVHHLLS